MKKIFPLRVPGKSDPRVLDAIKHDVRKYVKRERGKTLPEGFDQWEFDCRVGASAAVAVTTPLNEIGSVIDHAAGQSEVAEIYIEILSRAGHRAPRIIVTSASPAPEAPPPVGT